MTSSTPLDCPVCKRPLAELTHEQSALRRCEACGGVWLTSGQSRRLIDGALTAEERKLAREVTRRSRPRQRGGAYRTVPRTEGVERPCPTCDTALAQSTVDPLGVVVDRCDLHGTWFDAGELRVVAQWFELRADGLSEDLAQLALLLRRGAKRPRRRPKAR
ncbi:MAG: zf-TFIIB domain-containing protein [Myxococcales bacterium]|nr:zf-TFIIB domain-containing protein [Myxococcales bacterium]